LSATFGEYRPTHLHSGVDLRTGGKNGYRVYAVSDGRIVRLKYTRRGYGKALYLKHPDGYTSVYAHLSYFNNRLGLEDILEKKIKSTGQKYPGNIFLEKPVKVWKGDVLGYSGESGSGLPHLHFEIRDREDQPVNPYRLGLGFQDEKRPTLQRLIIEPVDHASTIDGNRQPKAFGLEGDVPVVPILRGRVRLKLEAFDEAGASNRCGLYEILVHLDDSLLMQERFDTFQREESYQVGTVMDPTMSHLSPTVYTYNLFRQAGSRLGELIQILPSFENHFDLSALKPGNHQFRIMARDAAGNEAVVKFPFVVNHPPTVRFTGAPAAIFGPVRIPVQTFDADAMSTGKRQVKAVEAEHSADGGITWHQGGITPEFLRFRPDLKASSWTLTRNEPFREGRIIQIRVRAFDGREYSPWVRSPAKICLEEGAENYDHLLVLPAGTGEPGRIPVSFHLAAPATVSLEGHSKEGPDILYIKERTFPTGWQRLHLKALDVDHPSWALTLQVRRPERTSYLGQDLSHTGEDRPAGLTVDNRGSYMEFLVHQPAPTWSNPVLRLTGPSHGSFLIPTRWMEGDQYKAVWPLDPSHGGGWSATVSSDPGGESLSRHFEVRAVSREEGGRLDWSDLQLVFPEGALYHEAFVTRRNSDKAGDPQLPRVSPAYRLETTSYPFDKPVEIRIKADGRYGDFRRLGIYSYNRFRRLWTFVGAVGDEEEGWVSARVRHFSDYVILEDIVPPTISSLTPSPGSTRSKLTAITFALSDRGMGIDDSRTAVILDGKSLESEYDPDRGTVTAPLTGTLRPGKHHFSISAFDRAGNPSRTFKGQFFIRGG
jgi:hypothetical protein